MKELTYFYLPGCPYCRRADQLLEELREQYPRLCAVPIRRINEKQEAALAARYDYFLVPCFFCGNVKLHEGAVEPEQVLRALRFAAGDNI